MISRRMTWSVVVASQLKTINQSIELLFILRISRVPSLKSVRSLAVGDGILPMDPTIERCLESLGIVMKSRGITLVATKIIDYQKLPAAQIFAGRLARRLTSKIALHPEEIMKGCSAKPAGSPIAL